MIRRKDLSVCTGKMERYLLDPFVSDLWGIAKEFNRDACNWSNDDMTDKQLMLGLQLHMNRIREVGIDLATERDKEVLRNEEERMEK